MARPRIPRPTDAELQILGVLWERGSATVRELYKALHPIRHSGYNSVLKLVQIMHAKEYVHRDDTQRPQVYRAAVGEEATHKLLLKDLMDRVFGGSSQAMIEHLLALKKPTPAEIASLRRKLDQISHK